MDLARSGTKLFIAQLLGAGISFLGVVYFARELGAAEIGMFFLFQAVLGSSAVFSDLGTRAAIEKRISEGEFPGEILTTGIILKIFILAVVMVVLFIFSSSINEYLGANLTLLLAIAIMCKEGGHLMSEVLKGELRVGESAEIMLLNKVIWIGMGSLLIALGYGFYSLVYGIIAGFLAKFVWGWYKISTPFATPSVSQAYSIWEYAKYAILPSLDEYSHNWVDLLLIGFFLTSAAVGAYEVAWRILTPVFMLTTAIGATIFPQISSWDAKEETDQIEQMLPKAITPSMLLIIPSVFGAGLFSSDILSLLFGEGFEAAALALPILVIGLIPRAIREITGKALLGINRPDLVTRAAIVDIVANIVFNVILIWRLGIVGAAIGTSLSFTVAAGLRWYYVDQYLTVKIPYREIGWCTLSSIGMFLVLLAMRSTMRIETVPRLFMVIGVGVVIYCSFVVLYGPIRRTITNQVLPQ